MITVCQNSSVSADIGIPQLYHSLLEKKTSSKYPFQSKAKIYYKNNMKLVKNAKKMLWFSLIQPEIKYMLARVCAQTSCCNTNY